MLIFSNFTRGRLLRRLKKNARDWPLYLGQEIHLTLM
ncbi:GSCOCG00012833001-RA-CDS [Cotesia congregata]|nr:GSCOCG00012833001-RA-CDS [Cotesia congregata]